MLLVVGGVGENGKRKRKKTVQVRLREIDIDIGIGIGIDNRHRYREKLWWLYYVTEHAFFSLNSLDSLDSLAHPQRPLDAGISSSSARTAPSISHFYYPQLDHSKNSQRWPASKSHPRQYPASSHFLASLPAWICYLIPSMW